MINFRCSIPITVRVGDLNYGNHVGHQNFLLYFQEARIAYLKNLGFSELDIGGTGMIISEVTCRYRRELFLGDVVAVGCRISEFRSKAFIMAYQIEKEGLLCATGVTTNLCFDYGAKKVVPLPLAFLAAAQAFEKTVPQAV